MSDRHQMLDQILKDRDFWTRLEFVASRWLETSDDQNLRQFWIDGFLPENARNTRSGADFEGMAWVCDGPRTQDQYRFTVSFPQKMLHAPIPNFVIDRLSIESGQQILQIVLAGRKSPL